MGKRKAETREFWAQELAFIAVEAVKGSRRMRGFAGYVDMQARCCEADGFADLAREMRQWSPSARAPSGAGCDETSHYRSEG